MRRRKASIAATILVSIFVCANVHAEVIASRLIAFDSFVRIPFPDKVRAEIISENPAASRQLLKLSRTLKAQERAEVESALKESGHVRSVRWTGQKELTLEFRHVRATAVEITPDLWAAVVKRPTSFPVVAVLGEEVCKTLFAKTTQFDLRLQLENLCLGSREWVAKPGVYSELSPSQEYVADVLRLFTLPEMPSPETLGKWVAESDGQVEDQLSVMILQASALIYAGDDVAALTVLAQVDKIEHLASEVKTNINLLGVATFERAIEMRTADGEAEAARSVWRRFNRWDSEEIDFETKLKLADWFSANEEYAAAILQLQQLLARGFEDDLRVLEPLAATYKAAGQDYRAFATLRFIAEMQ
jgi:hypothetical protein